MNRNSVYITYQGRSIEVVAPVRDQKLAMLVAEEQLNLIFKQAAELPPGSSEVPEGGIHGSLELEYMHNDNGEFMYVHARFADPVMRKLMEKALLKMTGEREDKRLDLSLVVPLIVTGKRQPETTVDKFERDAAHEIMQVTRTKQP